MRADKLSVLTLAVALAACGDQASESERSAEHVATPDRQHRGPGDQAVLPVAAGPAQAPPSAAEQTVSEEPFTSESAQGAADVVQLYYALIEAGRYRDAWRLRWDSGGPGVEDFIAGFAPYAEYHATIGAPSEIQGAAGSLYVDVPVQLYGRRRDGKPFGSAGTITLRRVNAVPGSTQAERRWRIFTKG